MREHTAVVMAVLLAVSMVAVPVAGLAATGEVGPAQTDDSTSDGQTGDQSNTNETTDGSSENDSVAPGERFAGVVGVQESEIEGEVEERTFGIRVANSATDESRADVVRMQLDDVEERLEELEDRREELEDMREDGEISEGRYRAEMSDVAAQIETTKRLANRSENVSQGLPADLLESKGINASATRTLQQRANDLSGPEVSEIARDIAGDDVGEPAEEREDELEEENEREDEGSDDRGPDERPGQDGDTTGDEDIADETSDEDISDETESDDDNDDITAGGETETDA